MSKTIATPLLPLCPPYDHKQTLTRLQTQPGFDVQFLHWLLAQQTPVERRFRASLIKNGVGFTAVDAEPLTKLGRALLTRAATPQEHDYLKTTLPKYAKQFERASRN